MQSSNNLNDIPLQFRQYSNIEKNLNLSKKEDSQNNIFEKKEIHSQKNNYTCKFDINDKIFVFLVLIIFFDLL